MPIKDRSWIMTDIKQLLVALVLALAFVGCGDSPPGVVDSGTAGDTDTDADADTDGDSDGDTDGDTDADTDSDSDTDTDTDTGSDTGTGDPTPCDELAAEDPDVVCCPETPPEDCEDASWEFSSYDGPNSAEWFGCCVSDLSAVVWCGGGGDPYNYVECNDPGESCGLTTCSQMQPCMDCDNF
jgi:hypothetical protein